MTKSEIFETAWGPFGMVARSTGNPVRWRLVATFLPERRERIQRAIAKRWPDAVKSSNLLPRFRRQVVDYFAGRRTAFKVELDLTDVPPFHRLVLEACHRVPYGKVSSYGELARVVGNPAAARAVGGAMANNPLPLVIPCHRVLRSDGSMGGFSSPSGVKLKERLLRLENAPCGKRTPANSTCATLQDS